MRLWSCLAAAASLAGCAAGSRHSPRPIEPPAAPAPAAALPLPIKPVFPDTVPDAVPRVEPRSRYGNPPFYDVLGHRYYVLSSAAAYAERGVASWYGPGFHQVRTSNGDTYDMYGMSAAHKTLPLPAYVRVTNLQNGRSVVVRVNDRGPFVGNRIIDLSYTAAAKLDMLRNGTAFVEVRAIDPAASPAAPVAPPATSPPPAAAPAPPLFSAAANLVAANEPAMTEPAAADAASGVPGQAVAHHAALFVQAGAFSDPGNAERLAARLRGGDYGKIFVRDDVIAGRKMYRVRIGPVPNVQEFDRIVAALAKDGVHDAHLAMD